MNLKRRHLTQSQKGAIGIDAEALFAEESKERQRKAAEITNAKKEGTLVAEIPQAEKGKSRDKAASALGVSPRYIQDAKAIKAASPETFEKVKAGEIMATKNPSRVRGAVSE